MSDKQDDSKRKFVKTLGYVAPAIITLKAVPAFAAAGSGRSDNIDRNDNHNNEGRRGNDRDGDGGGRHHKGRHRRD